MIVENNESSDENSTTEELPDDNDAGISNPGWVDSIAKILKTNKPKGKKTLVLSKAKKLTDVRKLKPVPAGFEVATEEGKVTEVELEQEQAVENEPARKKKKELPTLRIKPNILEKDRERTFNKIATKGVVQLFNAVRMQQKEISTKLKEAGPLEVRKEKVLKNIDKRAFLDVLMGEKSVSESADSDKKKEATETAKKATWSVLRDDFMMEAKLKDWDKQLEECESETEPLVESE